MNSFYKILPLGLLLAAFGCKTEEAVPTPAVATVTPAEGKPGTLLTIQGTGMSDLQRVMFGDAMAPFNPAFNTNETLLIRVPTTAKYGKQTVVLMNKGGDATQTSVSFTVLQPEPTVEKFAPTEAAVGDTLTITGKIFDNLTAVNFGTVKARVLSSTATMIRVIVPDKVEKAAIEVVTVGGAAKSALDFSPTGTGLYLFDEAIIGEWQNWSWSKVDLANTEKALKGTKSVKVSYGGYGGFWLNNPNAVDLAKFTVVKFSVFGGDTKEETIRISYRDNDTADAELGKGVIIKVKPGVWTEFTLPIKDLGTAKKMKAILFQEFSGTDNQPAWFDEIKLQ